MTGPDLSVDPGLITDITASAIRDRFVAAQDGPPILLPAPKPVGWHRHRWTAWGDVFSSTSGGIASLFAGYTAPPWWQERTCIRCHRAERRRVEVDR